MKRKNLTRILIFFLTLLVSMSLFACNSGDREDTDVDTTAQSIEASETESYTESDTESDSTEAVGGDETEGSQSSEATTSEDSEQSTEESKSDCAHTYEYDYNLRGHRQVCSQCGHETERVDHEMHMLEKGEKHECVCGYTKSCGGSLDYAEVEGGHVQTACDICGITDDVEAHELGLFSLAETYKTTYIYGCEKCGLSQAEWAVRNSINYHSFPGGAVNFMHTGTPGSTKAMKHDIRVEEGIIYDRITINESIAALNLANTVTSRGFDPKESVIDGSGKYFVLKFRAHNVGNIHLLANSDAPESDAGTFSWASSGIVRSADAIKEDEWLTYVIDVSALGSKFYTAENGDVTKASYGLYFSGQETDGSAYIDIAYFAVCDSWSEVALVTGENMVWLTDWAGTAAAKRVYSSDGSSAVITTGEDADKVIYQKNGEKMYIYIKSPYVDKYTRYEFKRMKTGDAGAGDSYDCWKILNMDICDSDLNVLYSTVVGASECEGALQEPGAADFIGGYHGDEYMTKLTVLVDGVELDMTKNYLPTACTSVQAVVESYLNRCGTTEKVFERVKTDTWTENGLEINNKYVTKANITIQRPATSMLAIAFKDGIITEHRNTNNESWIAIPDFTVQGAGSLNPGISSSGVTWAEFRGKLNVRVEMTNYEINDVATSPVGWFSYDYWGMNSRRVKIYIEPFQNRSLVVGDVFECTSRQTIFAAQ